MASHAYHFVTHWRVPGRIDDVYRILSNGKDYVRWWPEVYLRIEELKPGTLKLFTKGWLPYRLRWTSQVVDTNPPHGFRISATGDFEGRGIWKLVQDGAYVNIEFDWKLRAEKPLLKYLSFIMKPVFSWNHQWAMRKGEEALKRELQRT